MTELIQKQQSDAVSTGPAANGLQLNSQKTDQDSLAVPASSKGGVQGTVRKSTGPRTAAGKERSKLNAVKHGLSAKTVLLEGEKPEQYRSLLGGLLEDFQPRGTFERFLVEQLAQLLWCKRRSIPVENDLMPKKLDQIDIDPVRGQMASDRLLRYITFSSHEIDRVLNRLERLQRMRQGQLVTKQVDVTNKSRHRWREPELVVSNRRASECMYVGFQHLYTPSTSFFLQDAPIWPQGNMQGGKRVLRFVSSHPEMRSETETKAILQNELL